jgi:hypothetical protein
MDSRWSLSSHSVGALPQAQTDHVSRVGTPQRGRGTLTRALDSWALTLGEVLREA